MDVNPTFSERTWYFLDSIFLVEKSERVVDLLLKSGFEFEQTKILSFLFLLVFFFVCVRF